MGTGVSTAGPAVAGEDLLSRLQASPGLAGLVAAAESTWQARAVAAGDVPGEGPRWRGFEDAFPTFYEFTNRPRR